MTEEEKNKKAIEYIENEIKKQGLSMFVDTGLYLNKILSILKGD